MRHDGGRERGTAGGAPGAPPAEVLSAPFAAGWRGGLRLLRGPFRTLVSGQGLGQLSDGLAEISFAQLVLFDVGRGASPARIATVLAATLLPFSVAGPLSGVFIDRWDRRRALVVASWLRAALALVGMVAAVTHAEVAAFAGVLLLLSSSRFVLDTKGAILPRTVPAEDLVRANAMSGLLGMSAAFVGAVGGAMFVAAVPEVGFLAAAAGYLTAGMLFGRLPFAGGGHRDRRIGTALGALGRDLWAGVQATATIADLRRPLLAVWAHRLLLGGGFILLVLVADSRYHLSVAGYGLALAVTGICAFTGSICAPLLVARWRPVALLPLAFLPPAAAGIAAGYAPMLVTLLAAVAVTAFSFQCLKVLVDALVGRAAPDAVRGRVFALYDVLYNVAFVLAGLAMVPLWHPGQERALLWWLGAAAVVGWLGFARLVRGWPFAAAPAVSAPAVSAPAVSAPAVSAPPARRWAGRAAALVAGALPVLAFPKPGVWWLAWGALLPWLALLRRAPSAREAAVLSWCGGAGFIAAMHYWLLPSTTVLLAVIAAVLGVLWVPWGLLARRLLSPPLRGRRLVAAVVVLPAGWVAVEAIRSWSALGGPWGLLGASPWRSPAFLAPASLGGVWLVSYLIVAANIALLAVVLAPAWRTRAAAGCLAVVAVLAGPLWFAVEPLPAAAGTVDIAVVEAGVVHGPGARLDAQVAATAALPPGRFRLVVWGESSVGFDLASRPDILRRLTDLAASSGADLLVNVDAASAGGAIRKTSVLIGPEGVLGTYAKMRLVPFGEYIPVRPLLGWLASVTKAAAQDRLRGDRIEVLHTGDLAFSPLICFESAFPDMSRSAVRAGADLLVFQTATTTFQGTWAPDQHASLAAVRAVETGRPTVHAALSGTTAAFDARGQLLAWWPAATGTVPVAVPRAVVTTPFDVLGDWVPAWSFAALAAAALSIGLSEAALSPGQRLLGRRRPRARREDRAPSAAAP